MKQKASKSAAFKILAALETVRIKSQLLLQMISEKEIEIHQRTINNDFIKMNRRIELIVSVAGGMISI